MLRSLIIIVALTTVFDLFSQENSIQFSGYRWQISHAPEGKAPGPNIFLVDNVVVDSRGRLVLRIRQGETGWSCAELRLTEPLGYGTYEIEVETDPAMLDPMSVFGFFTYDHTSPPLHRELDIEFAAWGEKTHPGGNMTVQPYTLPQNSHSFPLQSLGTRSLHRIEWYPDFVRFSSWSLTRGDREQQVAEFLWREGEVFTPGEALVHLNLWLFQGQPPLNGKPMSIRIPSFRFIPAEPDQNR